MIFPRNTAGQVQFTPPAGRTGWPPVADWTDADWSWWLEQQGWTTDRIQAYLHNDRYLYGVGLTPNGERAGPHNAHELGVRWLYLPTPIGVTLHATRTSEEVTNFLWGGSAGGTKSMTARWEAIQCCLWPPRDDYRVIIVRRELEELRRTHLDKIDAEAAKICDALGDAKAIKVTNQPPLATFMHTGAKIVFGFAAAPGDELRYLSEHYDLFLGDEATTLHWKQIVGIQSRLRNDPKLNQKSRMILTTNPGGPSHDACMRHFITKAVSKEENPLYNPVRYQFLQAKLWQNPYFMSVDGSFSAYEERLHMFEPERRKQLLDGDWDAIVGQFFLEFDPLVHVHHFASVA